jgi:hypothetical protein
MKTTTLQVFEPTVDGTPEVGRILLFWMDGRRFPMLGSYAYDEEMEMHVYKVLGNGKTRSIYMDAEYYAYVEDAKATLTIM